MFDIGFTELLLISVVALLVIGPERLPKVARTVGLWLGRGRAMLLAVKADIDQEMKTDELKRIMQDQANSIATDEIIEEGQEIQQDIEQLAKETEATEAASNQNQTQSQTP